MWGHNYIVLGDSLGLMVVFKSLVVWSNVCGDMATSFVFPLFASHLLFHLVGELLSFWTFLLMRGNHSLASRAHYRICWSCDS